MKATIPGATLATAGDISVKVVTADPGGGTSNTLTFSVTNPAPAITSITPNSIVPGSGQTTLTINGTGFYSGSVARATNTSLVTTYVSSIKLTATLPSSFNTKPGGVNVSVLNAAPGGGTSNNFTILIACDSSGVDLQLGTLGAVSELFPTYATSETYAKFSASSTCPATLSTTVNQPSRMIMVQNTTSATATLSAWAVCTGTSNYDSFLTFYRSSTKPDANTRTQCTGVVSEGASGAVPAAVSPEPGSSTWCPGLTKTNGYGLSIGICEKIVVHIQPYNYTSTSFPPPPSFKIRVE